MLAEVGLPISIGIARTKFLAKVASGVAKPDGLLVVEPDDETNFLYPLNVRRLWGVGPVTAERLASRGITTVADVAAIDEANLMLLVGRATGRHLHALAHHQDARRVETGKRRSSIGSQRSLVGRTTPLDRATAESILTGLADGVCERLRTGNRVGHTVTLGLRNRDMKKRTRSKRLVEASDSTADVTRLLRTLLASEWPTIQHTGITMLAVRINDLFPNDAIQLALPLDGRPTRPLDETIDAVRKRFGGTAVRRAGSLAHDPGISVPLLPDPIAG